MSVLDLYNRHSSAQLLGYMDFRSLHSASGTPLLQGSTFLHKLLHHTICPLYLLALLVTSAPQGCPLWTWGWWSLLPLALPRLR